MKKNTAQKNTEKKIVRRGGIRAYTKRELVVKVGRDKDVTQEVAYAVVQGALDAMMDVLVKGRVVEFRDFGVFEPVVRKARIGRNPKKPEVEVPIPERRTIKFRPGRKFRELLGNTAPQRTRTRK